MGIFPVFGTENFGKQEMSIVSSEPELEGDKLLLFDSFGAKRILRSEDELESGSQIEPVFEQESGSRIEPRFEEKSGSQIEPRFDPGAGSQIKPGFAGKIYS